MIQYNPRTWLSLIFHPYSRKVVKSLLPGLLVMGIYTALMTYIIEDYFELYYKSTTVVHSLLGIVLGLFLVFRINSAYDRWWEGRKFWGSLLNNSRSLATKISVMLTRDEAESKKEIAELLAAYAAALRLHLKKTNLPLSSYFRNSPS